MTVKAQLPQRTVTIEVTEEPARIVATVTFDVAGDFKDDMEIYSALEPVLKKYWDDTRKLVLVYPKPTAADLVSQAVKQRFQ